MRKLIINQLDYAPITRRINEAKQLKSINSAEADKLMTELNSAKIVSPEAILSNVGTMNSVVKISFLNYNR